MEKPPSRATERTAVPADNPLSTVTDMLQSWKEIAAFLERDERTAMRWAKEQGMPVRRVPGAKRSRVSASRAEISCWLSQHLESPPIVAAAIPQEARNRSAE